MALLNKVTVSGISNSPVITPQAVAASDTIAGVPGASYMLIVVNASGSTDNVSVDDPTSVGPAAGTTFNPDAAVIVSAGTSRTIWLRDSQRFINPTTGLITVTHSQTATVTIYVVELL